MSKLFKILGVVITATICTILVGYPLALAYIGVGALLITGIIFFEKN